MMIDDRTKWPIGVFDSGIGGLSVLKVLKEAFPNENFIYIGDNLNNPVGNRPYQEITSLACHIGSFLATVPVKMMVVACNTFTVVALDDLRAKFSCPIVGVCQGVKTAIQKTKTNIIGIMATAATVQTHIHKHVALEIEPQLSVWEQPCPDLAHIIEKGHLSDAVVETVAKKYIAPIIEKQIDVVVLGCTHYPFITTLLEKITDGQVLFIDPSYETADLVGRVLSDNQLINRQAAKGTIHIYFTKDVELASELASEFIDPAEFSVEKIAL